MGRYVNLMNSIWFGEKPTIDGSVIQEQILKSNTEKEVLLNLIELFKVGDFSQKKLLIQLMNQTKDDAILNLSIRVFCSIATHKDLSDSANLTFLGEATEDSVNTFASATTSSLSLEVVPYLLALLDDWDDISDTSLIIRDSIDSFINFEEELGEDVEVDEIGEFYLKHTKNHDSEKYYFHQKLAFPGDIAKEMFERVMMIAAKGNDTLKMDFIPSLLSIWTGEKAPFEYNSVIEERSVKEMISYIDRLSQKSWEKGQKYFYSYKL